MPSRRVSSSNEGKTIMWSKAKKETPFKVLLKDAYESLEKRLEEMTDNLHKEFHAIYYIPACPSCGGILGHKCMSPWLVCYRCGKEFKLHEQRT
jgi:hypothetical protein